MPPVLLLHGLGANAYSWLLQFPALLDQGHRVIAPDLRGYGSSSFPPTKLTVENLTHDVNKLVQSLGIKTFYLAGISLGGVVATQYVIDYPSQVDRLILINTAARFRPDSLSLAAYYATRFVFSVFFGVEKQAQLVANQLFPLDDQANLRDLIIDQILAADPRAYRATILSLAWYDARKWLSDIQIPTLVITGQEDTTVSPRFQKELAVGIPNAAHITIPGTGHALVVEKPDLVNQIINEFLAG